MQAARLPHACVLSGRIGEPKALKAAHAGSQVSTAISRGTITVTSSRYARIWIQLGSRPRFSQAGLKGGQMRLEAYGEKQWHQRISLIDPVRSVEAVT